MSEGAGAPACAASSRKICEPPAEPTRGAVGEALTGIFVKKAERPNTMNLASAVAFASGAP